MTGMSKSWRVGGALYVLAVFAFATYVYVADFDLIRFLWLGTAPLGLTVPYISYLASIPLMLLGPTNLIDSNALVPWLITLWTLAAAGNALLAHLLWNELRSQCRRCTATRAAASFG
ncbi:hypothetical protein [Kribbella jiaozuonensis]|uniref:Uncharacterized protein n=1 Tax=Kribbella jiaozuonensis TaxID=2575441 RepID=A0A4U3LGL7_9ACTN|nr:hypothetical protein [Kribbella jiaozuonensis]TKK74611.1 hypothetical protein FDA38_38305 [Kribbella jiaozuonensis]